jgi:hypothetical protein
MLKNIWSRRTYTWFWLTYMIRNKVSTSPNNIYSFNENKFGIIFNEENYSSPTVIIRYFGDDTGQTYIRCRVDTNNHGYLEKIYVNEDMRSKHIATDLANLTIDQLFPHIQIWHIVGIYPTSEARGFWDSVISGHPDKIFIKT